MVPGFCWWEAWWGRGGRWGSGGHAFLYRRSDGRSDDGETKTKREHNTYLDLIELGRCVGRNGEADVAVKHQRVVIKRGRSAI